MGSEQLTQAIGALSAVDVASLTRSQLRELVVALRRDATRLEVEIARFVHAVERDDAWRDEGATSMESWLAASTGATLRSARSQVGLADTLAAAPQIAEAMVVGTVSIDNARLLGAVVGHDAFDQHADELIELASGAPRDTRRGLEHWLSLVDPDDESEREAERADREFLRFTPDGQGMHDVAGKLTDASVAAVHTALQHLAGAAWADETGRAQPKRLADAWVELARAYSAGSVSGGRERPKVLAMVPFETLVERAAARGVLVGTDTTVSGDEARRLACTAEIHRVITSGRSVVLDFGAATRLVSESQYLALVARDGGCRWPGCDRPPQWCEAHHIDEVHRDDGPTDLHNLALFCSYHHHLVHQRRWSLHGDAHDLHIHGPGGQRLDAPPKGGVAPPQRLVLSG